MQDIVRAFVTPDPELVRIVELSLGVSLSASIIAKLIGAPLGGALAVARFRGRKTIIVLTNALLGLPPVVVGLAIYLVLSRSGPLGFAGLLFTRLLSWRVPTAPQPARVRDGRVSPAEV